MSQIGTWIRLTSIKGKIYLKNFDQVYKDNYQKMYCVAIKMVSDGDIVYDILQEVFIYYYKKLENGVEIKYPKTWLVRATINKCFDHLKYKAKHRKIEDIAPIAISDDCSEQDQKRMILNHALSKLKDKEKTLVLLYGEGMSYKEISKVTGINETSVGKTLSRSLKKFETILKSIDHEMY